LKKAAQKLLFIWAMGAISPTPMAQINKSLFGSFSVTAQVPFLTF
jgi:hypothetical protein